MLKSVHFQALTVWIIYTVITKGSFLIGMSKNWEGRDVYLLNIVFSVIFGLLFLYLFSHEDFFSFAKEIEKKNSKKEKNLLHRFQHLGKFLASVLIGVMSGPLVGALAVRFLLHKSKYKYFVIIISSALSATIWLGIARGVIPLRLPF